MGMDTSSLKNEFEKRRLPLPKDHEMIIKKDSSNKEYKYVKLHFATMEDADKILVDFERKIEGHNVLVVPLLPTVFENKFLLTKVPYRFNWIQ